DPAMGYEDRFPCQPPPVKVAPVAGAGSPGEVGQFFVGQRSPAFNLLRQEVLAGPQDEAPGWGFLKPGSHQPGAFLHLFLVVAAQAGLLFGRSVPYHKPLSGLRQYAPATRAAIFRFVLDNGPDCFKNTVSFGSRTHMGRPKKCRWVETEPGVTFFKPRGIPLRSLEQMVITVDELEAMRLADFLEMTQEEVAQKMQVSRPTVTRMLARAHRAVAEALVNGKAICIEGGDYRL